MTADQSVRALGEDEIDLREVFAVLRRRGRWVVGGSLLGLALAVGAHSLQSRSVAQVQVSMIVDVAQGPCFVRARQLKSFSESDALGFFCWGEVQTMRQRLIRLAKHNEKFMHLASGSIGNVDYNVDQLSFDANGKQKSSNQLVLNVTGSSSLAPQISASLAQIQQQMTLLAVNNAKAIGFEPSFGTDWIRIEKPTKSVVGRTRPLSSSLALGLLGGLVVGACSALIADRRSNRVFSQAELLRRLGHPMRLGLPAGPWTSPVVQVLVGQLATQLDQTLSWRVLSIARQHYAVAPLTQLLQQQGGPALRCHSADPLLSAVLRVEPCDKPTGLLVVVEPGFNSATALEEARLLISQMGSVQAVGVVLIGAQLPEELSSSAAG